MEFARRMKPQGNSLKVIMIQVLECNYLKTILKYLEDFNFCDMARNMSKSLCVSFSLCGGDVAMIVILNGGGTFFKFQVR